MSSSPASPDRADTPASSPSPALDDLISRLQTATTVKDLWKLASRIGMDAEQFEKLTGISPHRLRRGRGGDEVVPLEKNEPFVRCSQVFRRVVRLCNGDEAAARNWINAPAPVLKNRKPVEVAESRLGLKNVESLLGQLEKAAGLS